MFVVIFKTSMSFLLHRMLGNLAGAGVPGGN